MLIANSTMRALNDIAERERDVLAEFAPDATPERTANPLSAAPPSGAYFVTSDDRGRRLFTRDGAFAIQDGTLVDPAGRAVLGYADDSAALSPLRVDPVDAALGFASGARIEADGSISYARRTIDPRTGRRELQRETLGLLALARFAPGTKLQPIDAQSAAAPPGIAPHFGKPGDGNFSTLTPFARAGSGVDIDLGLQRLQEAYLALDAIRSAGQAQRSVEKTAMDLLK